MPIKHTIYTVSFFLATVLFSCTPLKISKIKNGQTIEKQGIIFYLPQTEITAVINIEKSFRIDGQFSKESQNFLPVKQKNSIPQYRIKNIQLTQVAEPDTSQCYFIERCKAQINLDNKNILLGFNLPKTLERKTNFPEINNFSTPANLPDYNDYFIKKNIKEVIDTVYKVVKRDSISYTKKSFVKKEIEKNKTDYAYDIYRYLIKLRKHKFKLIADINDSSITPNSLKIRLYQIDSLEQILKSLIAGKEIVTPSSYVFHFKPNSNNLSDTIAFFSESYGINQQTGKPIIIRISMLPEFYQKFTSKITGKGLPYRIPIQADVSLFIGKNLIKKQRIMISQMGKTLKYPSNIIRNKHISVSYNPLTGNIEKILKIQK